MVDFNTKYRIEVQAGASQNALNQIKSGFDQVGRSAADATAQGKTGADQMRASMKQLADSIHASVSAGELTSKQAKQLYGSLFNAAKSTDMLAAATGESSAAQVEHGESMFKSIIAADIMMEAYHKVTEAVKEFTVESAYAAAKTELAGVALQNLARVNNISAQAIYEVEARVKSLGITTLETRNTLSRFVQVNLDVSKAVQLARVAQDAAVISNESTAEALAQLTHGIVTMHPRILRQLGIMIQLEAEFGKYAATLGKTSDALTQQEKQQAVLNAVLEQGARLQGTYEAALETTGKQITSLVRYEEEAKDALGEEFLPILREVTLATKDFYVWLRKYPEVFIALGVVLASFVVAMTLVNAQFITSGITKFIEATKLLTVTMIGATGAAKTWAAAIGAALGWVAVIGVIAAIVLQLDLFQSAAKRAEKVTDDQVGKLARMGEAFVNASFEMKKVIDGSLQGEEAQTAYAKALALVSVAERERIGMLETLEDRQKRLTEVVGEGLRLKQAEAIAIITLNMKAYAEASEEAIKTEKEKLELVKDSMSAEGKARHQPMTEFDLMAQGMMRAVGMAGTLDEKIAKLAGEQKKSTEEAEKFYKVMQALAVPLGITTEQMEEIARSAGMSAEGMARFREELERANEVPPPQAPLTFGARDIAQTKTLYEQAKKVDELAKTMPDVAAKIRAAFSIPTGHTVISQAAKDIRTLLSSSKELGVALSTQQRDIMIELAGNIGEGEKKLSDLRVAIMSEIDEIGQAGIGGLSKEVETLTNKTDKLIRKIVTSGLSGQTEMIKAAQENLRRGIGELYTKWATEGMGKAMDAMTKKMAKDFEDFSAVQDAVRKAQSEASIAVIASDTDRAQAEWQKQTDLYLQELRDRHAGDEELSAIRSALETKHTAELKRQAVERVQAMQDEIDSLQAEVSAGAMTAGPFSDPNTAKYLANIAKIDLEYQQSVRDIEKSGVAVSERVAGAAQIQTLKTVQLQQERYRELWNSVEENAGRAFDDIFINAKGGFKGLFDFVKAEMLSLARYMFKQLTAALLTPLIAGMKGVQNPTQAGGGFWGGLKSTLGIGNVVTPSGRTPPFVGEKIVSKPIEDAAKSTAAVTVRETEREIAADMQGFQGVIQTIMQAANAIVAAIDRLGAKMQQGSGVGSTLGKIAAGVGGVIGGAGGAPQAAMGAALPEVLVSHGAPGGLGGGLAGLPGSVPSFAMGGLGAAATGGVASQVGTTGFGLGIGGTGASLFGTAGAMGAGAPATGWAATHGLYGTSFASMGHALATAGAFLVTNPIGWAILAGIGIFAAIKLRKSREDKFRDEIKRDFALIVEDKKTLKTIKQYGENLFGKDADRKRHETLRSEMVQRLLYNYAVMTGQDPSKLPFYQGWMRTAPQQTTVEQGSGETVTKPYSVNSYQHGGLVVGRTGLDRVPARLTAGEFVLNPDTVKRVGVGSLQAINSGQPVSGPQVSVSIAPVVNVSGASNAQETANLVKAQVLQVIRGSVREVTDAVVKGLQSDYRRSEFRSALKPATE